MTRLRAFSPFRPFRAARTPVQLAPGRNRHPCFILDRWTLHDKPSIRPQPVTRCLPHPLATARAPQVYGISRIMMHVTTSILSLDMYDVFYYGFGTGLAATLVFGAGAAYLAKQLTISSRVAVNKALAKVQASPAVTAALGTNIRLGMLRSYVTHTGHVSLASKKSFAWVEPRALFLFEVNGEKGDAFVHGEAVKHKGKYAFNVLAVDTLARKGGPAPQLVILKGDAQKLKRKGYLRGFLQTDRAMFIEQTAVEDDDARVAAQADLQPEEDVPPAAGAASSAAAGANAAAAAGGGAAGPSSSSSSQMR